MRVSAIDKHKIPHVGFINWEKKVGFGRWRLRHPEDLDGLLAR
jgi:hypothetical protein